MLEALYIAREKVLILLESFQSPTADPSAKGRVRMVRITGWRGGLLGCLVL
jgi:hypothetical protein